MSNRPISMAELDMLKQLKIVRADNEIYQRMLRSYYGLVVENGDLKNLLHGYENENKELIEINEELQDEVDSTRKDYDEIDNKLVSLKKTVRNFLEDLKKMNGDKENGQIFDVTL